MPLWGLDRFGLSFQYTSIGCLNLISSKYKLLSSSQLNMSLFDRENFFSFFPNYPNVGQLWVRNKDWLISNVCNVAILKQFLFANLIFIFLSKAYTSIHTFPHETSSSHKFLIYHGRVFPPTFGYLPLSHICSSSYLVH